MDRRRLLGAIAAVFAAGITFRPSPTLAAESRSRAEPQPFDLLDGDIPAEKAEEAQYDPTRGRRRRVGFRVRRRRVVYSRRRVNYGRRRSLYVRRRNAVRRSVRRTVW